MIGAPVSSFGMTAPVIVDRKCDHSAWNSFSCVGGSHVPAVNFRLLPDRPRMALYAAAS